MKVAFVYDRVNKWGGAERVLLELQHLFPDAPLYTSVYNQKTAPWADSFTVKTSYLQSLPFAKRFHEYYAIGMPSAFEQFQFDAYDLVISVSSEAAKGVITKPGTKHLCYCLTPTRYLWSGYDDYFSSSFLRSLSRPATAYLRAWETVAAKRPDRFIGISETVSKRIETYYQRQAPVIYPPVSPPQKKRGRSPLPLPDRYFLVVSRLVPYKKVSLAIRACNELKLPLIVVGVGSEEMMLRGLAGPTITFVGSVTDDELAEYYERATALLFPGEEDFGITVVEAQSFGKPVIAYNKGGATETILAGKTGLFFERQTVSSLVGVLKKFKPEQFSERDCRVQAKKFSSEKFRKSFGELVSGIV